MLGRLKGGLDFRSMKEVGGYRGDWCWLGLERSALCLDVVGYLSGQACMGKKEVGGRGRWARRVVTDKVVGWRTGRKSRIYYYRR